MSSTTATETTEQVAEAQARPGGWLNRNVVGMGATSLLADFSYETATTVLPMLLQALGAPAYALGLTEGLADALASFTKMASGWLSDQLPRRKPIVVAGYSVTAIATALMGLATVWPLILVLRGVAWVGKGLRKPARNALLSESVASGDRGKAFGLHRAGDECGAILGPLTAAWLIGYAGDAALPDLSVFRSIMLWTLLPGLGAVAVMMLAVQETPRSAHAPRRFVASLRELPASFRRFLLAVGVFGAGDFSRALLILAAMDLLTPAYGPLAAAQWSAVLFAIRNTAAATASFPVGWLSDQIGRKQLLVGGYFLGAASTMGLAMLFAAGQASFAALVVLFLAAGLVTAIQETLEGATTADFVADFNLRGAAYGLLGTVNGLGDFASSAIVGLLWTAAPEAGFGYAATMMFLGAVVLMRSDEAHREPTV